MTDEPWRVEAVRGGTVESVHAVSVVVLGGDGGPLVHAGPVDDAVFGRSALKPAQAVGAIEAGAELTDAEIAIAAGSHSGEPEHLALVAALLERHGRTPDELRCPPDLPLGEGAARRHLAAGRGPERLAMNCSGKHAAMLVAARGGDYLEPGHPVSRRVADAVDRLAGPVLAASVDGCGLPAPVVPLSGVARMARSLVTARPGSVEHRVATAMGAHPFLVAGTDRLDTALMRALPGSLSKIGAEGVLAVALPGGVAVAIKVHDGARRAVGPTLRAVLHLIGAHVPASLEGALSFPVTGGGQPVGDLRVQR